MLTPYHHPTLLEAGCDEAGRGCLAGPVVAAAVILPKDFELESLNDSKQLSERRRDMLRPIIEEQALAWAVAFVEPKEIDRINILKASFLAMHRAVQQLKLQPELLLIDGNRFTPYPGIPHHCFVKGDGRFLSIAAASVLAKTYRDAYMVELARQFPEYRWEENKGYPTQAHRDALKVHGSTPHHRKSFRLLPEQGKLF
ncbi:MAG: ribonuclease HII [Saprospirales bacterium]|nr:ribonuclease HII [Saprospirales bacterium]